MTQNVTALFGMPGFEVLSTENPSVLAYLRRSTGEDGNEDIVLCVNNLSRFANPSSREPGW